MRTVKACIFDLDGVIVETSHFHFLAWKRLAEKLEIPFSDEDNEQLKGVSRKESLDRILALGNREMDQAEKDKWMAIKNEWYLEDLEDMKPSDALPGVVDFIKSLRAQGVKISLASSSKNAKAIISKLQLNDQFDALKDGNDVKHAKPDPDIFLQAAEALGEKPENCIVFEDAIAGIEASIAADMRCVGVGDKDILTDANHVIQSFEEIDINKFSKLFD